MTTQADRLVSEGHTITARILRSIESAQADAHAFIQKLLGGGGVDVIDTYDWESTDLSKQEFIQAMLELQDNLPGIIDGSTTVDGAKLYMLETKL